VWVKVGNRTALLEHHHTGAELLTASHQAAVARFQQVAWAQSFPEDFTRRTGLTRGKPPPGVEPGGDHQGGGLERAQSEQNRIDPMAFVAKEVQESVTRAIE